MVAPAAASLDHVGRAPSLVRPVRRRPRGAPVAGRRGPRAPARRGYALVHDRLRPRHDHHEPPDHAARARARDQRARDAGGAAGADGRSHDRRRAGEDPPRAARRPCRGEVVRALLRDRRRDTAVSRAPVGGLALDGRQRARATAPRARSGRPRMDRRVRRPRRRRLRRVRAALQPASRTSRGRTRGTPSASATAVSRSLRSRRRRFRATSSTRSSRLAEVARHAWDDEPLAARLEAEADELAARFDAAFWIPDRGGYYALALDRDKRQVDALCSNIGHLLWSGIVPEDAGRADRRRAGAKRALVGMGGAHHVQVRRGVQPAQLPQRHGLAARHRARRVGPRPVRALGPRAPDLARAPGGRPPLRVVAPGGLRRLRSLGDPVPDRLPDGGAAAGVGRRHPHPPSAAPARAGAGHRAGNARNARGGRARSGHGIILEGVRALGRSWDVSCGAGASSIELAA